jgi:hypothetical protein
MYLLTYNFRVRLGTRAEDCSGFIFSKCELDLSGILSTVESTDPGINPSEILQCERHEKSFKNFTRPYLDERTCVCLSVCQEVGLLVGLSVCRYVSLSVCWSVYLFVCRPVCLPVCLFVCQSVSQWVCVYMCMSVLERKLNSPSTQEFFTIHLPSFVIFTHLELMPVSPPPLPPSATDPRHISWPVAYCALTAWWNEVVGSMLVT